MRQQPLLCMLFAVLSMTFPLSAEPWLGSSTIETLTGLKGAYSDEKSVFKLSWPRTDVEVRVDGWPMPPFMGLTSWAAFKPGREGKLMVMGDLVLLSDEVSPVMSALFAEGLQVTALHNHFLYDQPRVMFMHIAGEGDAERLATGVKAAIEAVRQTRATNSSLPTAFGPVPPRSNAISVEPLQAILESKPTVREGMAKFVIGRTAMMDCGCEAGKDMGVNTWAAFAGIDEDAVVCGDFVVTEDELQPVLESLRADGIHVVAIHHHMVGESPRYLFLHYWGRGQANDLAGSLRKALNCTRTRS